MNCEQSHCVNLAAWRPVLLLYPPADYKVEPIRMLLQLYICNEHKEKLKVDDFVDDASWQKICNILKSYGIHEPERKLTRVTFLQNR